MRNLTRDYFNSHNAAIYTPQQRNMLNEALDLEIDTVIKNNVDHQSLIAEIRTTCETFCTASVDSELYTTA